MHVKKLYGTLLFVCGVFYIIAQDSLKNKFEPRLQTYAGMIIPSYPDVPKSKFTNLTSLSLGWQTQGKDDWQQFYRFPKMGIECVFGSFSNPKNLGYAFGLVPFLEVNGSKPNKHWRFKAGFGAAYYTTPFDLITNPNNFYIGDHFTNMSIFTLLWYKQIGKNVLMNYGLSGIHSSNGHTALPNAGMNIVAVNLGLGFGHASTFRSHVPDTCVKRSSYVLKAGLGFHEFGSTTKAVGGPGYPSYHLSMWMNKPFRHSGSLQLGVTLAYYTSFYDYIISQEFYDRNQQLRSSTAIVFAGHEFVMGKFGFISQAGIYVYNKFFIDQKKYEGTWDNISNKIEAFNTNRIGLVYYPLKKRNSLNILNQQLQLGIFLKANLAQADLFEYSVGYVF